MESDLPLFSFLILHQPPSLFATCPLNWFSATLRRLLHWNA